MDLVRKWVFLDLNCHAIATVSSFDETTGTAKAQIAYKKTYSRKNPVTGAYELQNVDYPPIECPVFSFGGGGFSLTMPVAEGDECLVLFNDRDMDNWFQGNTGAAVSSARLHSFADGIILVGLHSLPNAILNYNAGAAELRNKAGTCKVVVSDDQVQLVFGQSVVTVGSLLTLTNAGGKSLGTLLGQLTSQLQTLTSQLNALGTALAAITVTCAGSGSPSSAPLNAAAFTAFAGQATAAGTQIQTIATSLAGLLA